MAISKTMSAKLNQQITSEFYSSQIYLQMACMCRSMSLDRLAAFFRAQAAEEREHALKILDYVLEVGSTVKLGQIAAPRATWPSVVAALKEALGHEQKVTAQINALVALAEKEKDYATRSFLNWYVDEQVEEEASFGQLVDVATMAGKNLLQLESYVGHLLANRQ